MRCMLEVLDLVVAARKVEKSSQTMSPCWIARRALGIGETWPGDLRIHSDFGYETK